MLVCGLTGGIGSGKTLCASIFELFRVPIYYADKRAKWLMEHDTLLIANLKAIFGPETYRDDGTLNRALLASKVFDNEDLLHKLNDIVHPAVQRDTEQWILRHSEMPYGIKEAAILFESGAYKACDRTICVVADRETRINRVVKRDGTSRSSVTNRMNNQLNQEFIISMSDYVIINDGKHKLIPQIVKLHKRLSLLSDKS